MKMRKLQVKSNKVFQKRRVIFSIFILLFLFLIGYEIVQVYKSSIYHEYYSLESRNGEILNTNIDNAQAFAWVRVQGTNIDTPVLPLNDKLESDINADYLWMSNYYKEGENRLVIYGHNVRNVSSRPEIVNPEHFRFEQLMSFSRYDFAKDNLYIQYSDGKNEYLYLIYAVSFNDGRIEYGQSYKEDKELKEYISSVRYNSIYDYDIEVSEKDELISLITCTRYFGVYEKTQFKVDARKLRENEKIIKYNVETNSNYDIIE